MSHLEGSLYILFCGTVCIFLNYFLIQIKNYGNLLVLVLRHYGKSIFMFDYVAVITSLKYCNYIQLNYA